MSVISTYIKFLVSVTLLVIGMMVFMPVTHAEEMTNTEIETQVPPKDVQAIIKKMLEQIQSLQKQLLELQKKSLMHSIDKKEEKRKILDAELLENLRVRSGAGLDTALVSVQQRGVRGEIIDGPVERGGIRWYKIRYSNGLEGWSAANWLKITERPLDDHREDHEEDVDKNHERALDKDYKKDRDHDVKLDEKSKKKKSSDTKRTTHQDNEDDDLEEESHQLEDIETEDSDDEAESGE